MTTLTYVGPDGATSDRYGRLERGRAYQESDDTFAAYLVATHPDHWQASTTPKGKTPKATKE